MVGCGSRYAWVLLSNIYGGQDPDYVSSPVLLFLLLYLQVKGPNEASTHAICMTFERVSQVEGENPGPTLLSVAWVLASHSLGDLIARIYVRVRIVDKFCLDD